MSVTIAQASCDERGRYVGGQAGNQTGTELNMRGYYASASNPWKCYRPKSAEAACRIAAEAKAAVGNLHVGYDQGQRNDLLRDAEAAGWSIAAVSRDTETDCSALAATCAICAGAPRGVLCSGGNLPYTGNFHAKMSASGFFDFMGTLPEGELCTGDVLCRDGHAVIVASGRPRGAQPATGGSDIDSLARAVIAGRYGTGDARRAALGESYDAVQARVNELLQGTPNAPGTSAGRPRIVAGRYKVIATTLNVRDAPRLSGAKVASYSFGERINSIAADVTEADGYVWARYTAHSGAARYVAIGTADGSEKYLAKC